MMMRGTQGGAPASEMENEVEHVMLGDGQEHDQTSTLYRGSRGGSHNSTQRSSGGGATRVDLQYGSGLSLARGPPSMNASHRSQASSRRGHDHDMGVEGDQNSTMEHDQISQAGDDMSSRSASERGSSRSGSEQGRGTVRRGFLLVDPPEDGMDPMSSASQTHRSSSSREESASEMCEDGADGASNVVGDEDEVDGGGEHAVAGAGGAINSNNSSKRNTRRSLAQKTGSSWTETKARWTWTGVHAKFGSQEMPSEALRNERRERQKSLLQLLGEILNV
eukprot:GSA25T00021050001.1